MKSVYIIYAIAVVLLFAMFGYLRSDAAPQPCPKGSYSIGDGLCKAEPTGCQYGDSISLADCEKFKPSVITPRTTKPVHTPDTTGK